jgi:hypothetical protein
MRLRHLAALGLAGAAALAGCTSDGPVVVNATGTVLIGAYVDRNANDQLDATLDANAGGVRVTVTPWAGGAAVGSGTTAVTGILILPSLPVGRYRVDVDTTSVGDTLQASIRTADITVVANDTARVLIPLTYPRRTVAQARQLAPGRRVVVQAIALTGAATFPDTTGAIADSTGTIRLTRVASTGFQTGDSVRVVATRGTRDGQPVLSDAAVYSVKAGDRPVATLVTAARATTAGGGALDAALVRIAGATILNAQITNGDAVLTVTDSSGTLQVFIDRTTGPISDPLAAGAILDATGVLVPIPGGTGWRLRPRTASDVTAHYPTVTTAQARLLEPGRVVGIIGVAVNGSAVFSDHSLHLADAAGALRTLNISPTVLGGDSVRLVGMIGVANGQPVLQSATATVLGAGHLPTPVDLTTTVAATADAGSRDAALARVRNARIVADTADAGDPGHVLTVDDGSGKLRVVLDPAGTWDPAYPVGAIYDVTGLLVPDPTGRSWVLKPRPRVSTDVVKH